MKDFIVIGIVVILVLAVVFVVISSGEKGKKHHLIFCQDSDPSNKGLINNFNYEGYGSLIDKLQCDYVLGIPNGSYIPVPIDRQPIDALPFNPGLKPCQFSLV